MISKTELNSVATYNLSSVGKALPTWLSKKRREKPEQKAKQKPGDDDRIEVIQDLFFPTACARVKVSPDGETLLASGTYPPQMRAYELRELSMKFSRHFSADVVQFQVLSPDWKKLVFLLADRSIEFHSQFGKHHTTRIPHFGRALAYHPETCELLLAGAGEEIFRLSLERGCFLKPLASGCTEINCLGISPAHGMLGVGSTDGQVQLWDPRQRSLLGNCSPFDAIAARGEPLDEGSPREVTALRFDQRGLSLAVGTSSGHVALYDIRRAAPMAVKDHGYGLPVVDLKFHTDKFIISADPKIIKIWDANSTGSASSNLTSIQPGADINDVAIYKDSGLIFAALETERLGAYFIPALGPAPRWCHFLDSLTEEMEQQPTESVYEDYKFVTRDELERLNLTSLIGSKVLRPYMHGFFIDARLHTKAVSLSQPFAYEKWRKERLQQKLEQKTAGRIAPVKRSKLPKVNASLAQELDRGTAAAQGPAAAPSAGASLLSDERFAQLFTNPDYEIDETAEEFLSRRPHLRLQQGQAAPAKAPQGSDDDGDSDGGDDDDDDDDDDDAGADGHVEGDGDSEGEFEDDQEQTDDSDDEGHGGGAHKRGPSASRRSAGVRMVGAEGDLLAASKQSAGVRVPASSSFGERLASLPDSPVGGSAARGAAELTFSVGGDSGGQKSGRGRGVAEGRNGGGRGQGGSGKGRGGRGGKRDRDASSDRANGQIRRSMHSGMLSREKGAGKGKGRGKGRGGGRGISKRGGRGSKGR